MLKTPLSEGWLLFCLGFAQFIAILDFMIVMPLAPDLGQALGIDAADLGWIGGSYSAAGALAGLSASLFLDRFDRKKLLLLALLGLALTTGLAASSTGLYSLLFWRFIAGLFGGPVSAGVMAIVSDRIPPERRGSAMGKVMGAFAAAAVLGVPFGLELARLGSWQTPFFATALLALGMAAAVWYLFPPMDAHVADARRRNPRRQILGLLNNTSARWCFAASFAAMLSSFILIPNLSAHVQFNLAYPREKLGLLYMAGGLVSFVGMRLAGKLADKLGSTPVTLLSTLMFMAIIYFTCIGYWRDMPVVPLFMGFMLANSARNVAGQTLGSKIPAPHERASFMALISALHNIGAAIGAFLSSQLLTANGTASLIGVERLGYVSLGFALLVPCCVAVVERRVNRPMPQPA